MPSRVSVTVLSTPVVLTYNVAEASTSSPSGEVLEIRFHRGHAPELGRLPSGADSTKLPAVEAMLPR